VTDVSTNLWDCLVIGGGPAGLTAALYLARFRRRVLVVDSRDSRGAFRLAAKYFSSIVVLL
jgi:thioredoxin reductase (NADPH)